MATTEEESEFWRQMLALLAERGWSQRELSRVTGIPVQTIQRWKNGAPGRDHLMTVARTLGVSMDDLAGAGVPPRALELARVVGVDAEAARDRARKALLQFTGPQTLSSRQALHPQMGVTTMNDDELGDLLRGLEGRLTREQLYGLALLIDGTGADAWRVRAALELLFPQAQPEKQ
jgi:transcriptional regulator with XRE-family HTH domain